MWSGTILSKHKGWIRFDQEPNTRDVVVYKNQIEHPEQNLRVLQLDQELTLQFCKNSRVQRMHTEFTTSSAL